MPRATSIKLPEELKERVDAAAEAAGTTPHAFMIEAIARETRRAELYEQFLEEARQADREVERSGKHYLADDVFRYMEARAAGKRSRRPTAKPWRK
jgi:predicted transcriptional regulator